MTGQPKMDRVLFVLSMSSPFIAAIPQELKRLPDQQAPEKSD